MLSLPRALASALLASSVALPLHAAELVTLRSGFTLTCTAHEALSTNTVRLHLASSDDRAENYLDIPLEDVATVENIADPRPLFTRLAGPSLLQHQLPTLLQQAGAVHNINVALLAAVVQKESAGNPRAVSHAGAGGLMQLMPGTAAQYRLVDRFSPGGNVNAGSAYLSDLLTRYHENLVLALAAYNAGPAAVDRYRGVPPFPETRRYVASVIHEFNRRVVAERRPDR